MTFDDWMLGISECHKPGDDGVTLRMLRACWAEAQAVERERCAKVCESAQFTGNTFPRTQLEQLRMDIAAAIRST